MRQYSDRFDPSSKMTLCASYPLSPGPWTFVQDDDSELLITVKR